MLRVGIVGSDNSHALAYASLMNVEHAVADRARAVAICGQDPARTEEVAREGQIEQVVESPEAMLGLVDAVFVEHRHGDLHADAAVPFLERGIPVFVDKPLAKTLADCARIIGAANASGTWLTSFSSLRTSEETSSLAAKLDGIGTIRVGQFAGPCDFESEYGGPIFYATHVAEVALRLMGEEVETISAQRSGKMCVANVTWPNDAIATFAYLGDAQYRFSASVHGTEGWVSGEIPANHAGYRTALGIILDGIESGERPFTDEQMVRPIAMVAAIEQSLANGGAPVEIQPLITGALGGA
jgi:predicted dehydrogenase